ncbi:hypothetical protein [Methylovorus glucosotrophus]|uniref:Uncharacterized protein n=1 Tax=Methylovorus glucosotrophus (strain SIP3-4) TaxID=582744 RepID=C6XEC7_METGS|nr:hypothetical protein [Methylovorus glucosotrophus]ACT50902.1 hypothetical protein Msip34_1657 [Methylovorus glucosotrophus SIP3-4]
MKGQIKNAIITSAVLSIHDHGFLDCWLMLDFGGSSQGFGGYALYLPESFGHHQLLSNAGHFLYRSLKVAGVDEFSQLRGKAIRADADSGRVYGIGHIVKDDWFYPETDFAQEVKA